jgi:hypothetical protein
MMESVLFASRQWWVGGAQSVIECAAGMNPPSLLPVSLIPIIYLPVTRSFFLSPATARSFRISPRDMIISSLCTCCHLSHGGGGRRETRSGSQTRTPNAHKDAEK